MPLTPTQTRDRLDSLSILPRKNLGQNFLVDGNIVKKSLALAQIAPGDIVVEIGPGLGTLCTALLEAGAEVFAVELDLRLAANLRDTLGVAHPGKFHLLEGDGVEHPLAGLPADHPAAAAGSFKIVANLPYAISTPWLDALLSGPLPERAVLMLQREASDRFTAIPGTGARSAISIFTDAAFLREPGHPVSRTCFFPMPQVDSFLLCLRRRPDARALLPAAKKIIRQLFTQRRKQIGSLVRHLAAAPPLPASSNSPRQTPNSKPEPLNPQLETPNSKPKTPNSKLLLAWLDLLPAHGLDSRARPEAIPTAAWLELDALLRDNSAVLPPAASGDSLSC